MFQTFPKSGKKGKAPGYKSNGPMSSSKIHDTGFYENQNLIGVEEKTRMNVYCKPGTSAAARQGDVMSLTYPITRYRSRRP